MLHHLPPLLIMAQPRWGSGKSHIHSPNRTLMLAEHQQHQQMALFATALHSSPAQNER
jgi:hypothetical protein